jgi:hypothetical protein
VKVAFSSVRGPDIGGTRGPQGKRGILTPSP